MAARFGRNKRRAARQAVATAEAAAEAAKRRLSEEYIQIIKFGDEHRALVKRVEEWDADVRRMLGEYSAFRFEAGRQKVQHPDPFRKVHVERPMRVPTRLDDAVPTAEMIHSTFITLKRFVIRSDDDEIRLRKIIRLIVEYQGEEELHFAYDIDGKALMRLGERDRRHLAQDVTDNLVAAVRKGAAR